MKRVLLVGHWDLSAEDLAAASDHAEQYLARLARLAGSEGTNSFALDLIRQGMRGGSDPKTDITSVVFGPNTAFVEALSLGPSRTGNLLPMVAGRREASTVGLGSELGQSSEFQGTILIEGGHSWAHDWGLGLLGALSGNDHLMLTSPVSRLIEAFEAARAQLKDRNIVFAASTSRPLLGPGATSVLLPDLRPRTWASDLGASAQELASAMAQWSDLLEAQNRQTLAARPGWGALVGHTDDGPQEAPLRQKVTPGRLPGSGAGAGSAAVLNALGIPVLPTTRVLATALNLDSAIADSDLLVVVEPRLDAPLLVDSALQYVAEEAKKTGTPVVSVGATSSLSSSDKAEFGIHGVSTLRPELADVEAFGNVGHRVAQTWLR